MIGNKSITGSDSSLHLNYKQNLNMSLADNQQNFTSAPFISLLQSAVILYLF